MSLSTKTVPMARAVPARDAAAGGAEMSKAVKTAIVAGRVPDRDAAAGGR